MLALAGRTLVIYMGVSRIEENVDGLRAGGMAETFLAGHGSPFVAQVSIANAPKLYRAILDGIEYRGTAFLQC